MEQAAKDMVGVSGMRGLSAVQFNPAVARDVRPLVSSTPSQGLAIGHAMRKLMHLCSPWTTGQAVRPGPHPWEGTDRWAGRAKRGRAQESKPRGPTSRSRSRRRKWSPRPASVKVARRATVGEGDVHRIDQASSSCQWSASWRIGLDEDNARQRPQLARMSDPPRRRRGRTFSVELKDNVFLCSTSGAAKQGDVIDCGRRCTTSTGGRRPSTWAHHSTSSRRTRPETVERNG